MYLLERWAAPWDKRLSLREWTLLATILEQTPASAGFALPWPQPSELPSFVGRLAAGLGYPVPEATGRTADLHSAPRRGREPGVEHTAPLNPRFSAYLSELTLNSGQPSFVFYPGLSATAWHDPARFPIVEALERHYPRLRDEVMSVSESAFQPESESVIRRTGNWDVSFLYECGRRHDEVCSRCPTLTTIIETHATIRTIDGLIYISRLRSGSAIQAHYGPNNLRLRCHIAVQVPSSDCGLSVNGESRVWEEGKCLVFDDSFCHHAWNHSKQDRIVVVIDLWHPDLSLQEIALLSGMQRFVLARAKSLYSYYDANAQHSSRC